MSDWSSNEPSAWYEHEIDETEFPTPANAHSNQQTSSSSAASQSQSYHKPSYSHSSQHQHVYRERESSHRDYHRSSQSVRDDRDYRDHPRSHDRVDRDRNNDRGGYDRPNREYRDYHRGGHSRYNNPPDHRERVDRDYDDRRDDRRHDRYRNADRYDRGDRGDINGGREYRPREREDRERDYHHYDNERSSHASHYPSSHHHNSNYHRSNGPSAESQQDDSQYEDEPEVETVVSDEEDEEPECPLCMEPLDATDRQFKPCKCGYQVCLWCFPAGTPITLANGMTRAIETFTAGELILSYDISENGSKVGTDTSLVHARNQTLVPRGEKSLIQLTLEDGRTLRCTPEHRLLVKDDKTETGLKWMPANEMRVNHDQIRVVTRGPTIESITDADNTWSTILSHQLDPFHLQTESARQRSLTLARVAGYAFRQVSNASTASTVHVSSAFDAEAFREDIAILTGHAHSCARVHETHIELPQFIIDLIHASSARQSVTLPTFLLDPTCPRALQREFIAGYVSSVMAKSNIDFQSERETIELPLTSTDLYLLQPLVQRFEQEFTLSSNMTRTALGQFLHSCGLRYCHLAATRLSLLQTYWNGLKSTVGDSSFTSFLTRCDATRAYDGERASFALRVVASELLMDAPELVYDLVVQSYDKSPNVHSFIAGSVIAHNCFHHINENLGGKCPACRQAYDTTGQMAADPTVLDTIAAKTASGGVRKHRDTTTVRRERKAPSQVPLAHVRVLQRNLLYVVGLPLQVAKDELLKSKAYFGKFGRIVKIALGLKNGAPSQDRKQTCSCYVTYKRGVDAVDAIKAVNGSILYGCLLKATYGTSKYCANWLRGAPCANPTCLYLHETADPKDCTTKDDLSAFLQETQPSTVNPQAIAINGLPGQIHKQYDTNVFIYLFSFFFPLRF